MRRLPAELLCGVPGAVTSCMVPAWGTGLAACHTNESPEPCQKTGVSSMFSFYLRRYTCKMHVMATNRVKLTNMEYL